MTALAGFWRFDGATDARSQCEQMLRAQEVYAPDRAVCGDDGAVTLGRRLFRLLPEDAFDRGPVTTASGGMLVADIRLDDRAEVGAALGLAPADTARLSDAALVGHALDRWAEAAIDRLIGDFAIIWWDAARGRLLLARDFAGQRPLHYHRGDGVFACASMPKGLHALAEIPRAASAAAAAGFLAHLPENGAESFFEGIDKVAPGHIVTVTRDGVSSRRFWQPRLATLRLPRAEDYAEALRAQLDAAVASRLRGADGRVAAHLSGGLDSSAVTATAARLLGPDEAAVTAYTSVPRTGFVSASRGIIDEGPLAAAVAALYPNIAHVRVSAGGTSPLDALGRNAFLYERPYLNLCNGVWVDAINDDARARGLRVMLTGSLGNASFSFDGMQRLPELLARGRFVRLAREGAGLLRGGMRAGTIAAATIGPFLPRSVWQAISRLRGRADDLTGYSMISPSAADDPALAAAAASGAADFSFKPRRDMREAQMWLLSRVDFGNYNKGTLGGWGIDVRDPSADRRLVEFCLSVPAEQYLAKGFSRALARNGLADRLPAAVTRETRKGYQGADWHEGLTAARGQLGEEIESIARDPVAAALIDIPRLRRLHLDWPTSSWEREEIVETYRLALLRGISMGHFVRQANGTN